MNKKELWCCRCCGLLFEMGAALWYDDHLRCPTCDSVLIGPQQDEVVLFVHAKSLRDNGMTWKEGQVRAIIANEKKRNEQSA